MGNESLANIWKLNMNDTLKHLTSDEDGMMTYDYIVNHVDECYEEMDSLVDRLLEVDRTGQFLASSARYLNAVDAVKFHPHIGRLVEGAIRCDRERKYISSLLEALWGEGYKQRAEELSVSDDNFRRIYKRVYAESVM